MILMISVVDPNLDSVRAADQDLRIWIKKRRMKLTGALWKENP
jgi:hypothetical protein